MAWLGSPQFHSCQKQQNLFQVTSANKNFNMTVINIIPQKLLLSQNYPFAYRITKRLNILMTFPCNSHTDFLKRHVNEISLY